MKIQIVRTAVVMLSLFLLSGCTTLWQDYFGERGLRKGVSSSLVDYLYPNGEIPPEHDSTIPHLEVPLHIGLAFVPSGSTSTPGLSEAHKSQLLEKVKDSFSDRDFISRITVIPDTYLRSSKGFDSVDQIARLYGLDVMALVSYDQVATSEDNRASIFYWTIVGAYVIKGSENNVQTFVDTAIFDVRTHKLLFRAPGVSQLQTDNTLINSATKMRETREQGFEVAMGDMTVNLEAELDSFRERIKQDKSVTVSYSEGYSGGGGSVDAAFLLLLLVLLSIRAWRNRDGTKAD